MSAPMPDPEKALNLQRLVRGSSDGRDSPVTTRRLPDDLATDETRYIAVSANVVEAAEQAVAALNVDLRFEHLDRTEDRVWRLVAECWANQSVDQVPAFVTQHAAEVQHLFCYLPVEYLTVRSENQLHGVMLVPVNDSRVPPTKPWFVLEKPTGCVAVVPAEGTSYVQMADRARHHANHVLRCLRIALGAQVHGQQLRFRLGIGYCFDERLTGWNRRDDDAYDIGLPEDISHLHSHPVMAVPESPRNDVERKAALAMAWMERAYFTGDELVAVLYRFFALEALLGDKSEGLKAQGLAFREMILSHIVTGGFRHPNETFFFYDQVRSAAVHGEEAPAAAVHDTAGFESAVREALGNYLELASSCNITRRGKLLQFLDNHPDRPKLIAWLRKRGGPLWTGYLDKLDGTPC